MERMRQPALHGAAGRHHCLADHLATEYPLPARLRAVAAKQVHLELLEVEDGDQVDQAYVHGALSLGTRANLAVISACAAWRRPGIHNHDREYGFRARASHAPE